ncbi:MAG TPA: hypothetical protein VFW09_16540, partial [Solirubrobacteraceae bacterium]|nr:hypothetical protein [Solirubrobacteraceae bacterium]
LALAGASYAALKLPKNSVGNRQIKRGAVAPPKFSKQIGGYVRMYAKIDAPVDLSTPTHGPSSSAGRLAHPEVAAQFIGSRTRRLVAWR